MILHAKAETLPKNPGFATAVVVAAAAAAVVVVAELIVLDVDPIPSKPSDALDVSEFEVTDVKIAGAISALVKLLMLKLP